MAKISNEEVKRTVKAQLRIIHGVLQVVPRLEDATGNWREENQQKKKIKLFFCFVFVNAMYNSDLEAV